MNLFSEKYVFFFSLFLCAYVHAIIYILNQLKLIHFSHVDSQLEHYVISAVAVQKLQLCYVFIVSGLTALTVRLVC